MLKATESQLAERLDEACSHGGVEGETTAELVRLEETLSEAARVAKQAVSLRRRLRTGHGQGGQGQHAEPFGDLGASDAAVSRPERRATSPDDQPHGDLDDESSVREFLDEHGVTWRVWAVTQEQLHPERVIADRMGDYREGWLAFECADGSERRRLPNFPPNWRRLTNLDLERLLGRAEAVRRRRSGGDDSESAIS
jgi:hypothetical protein